MNFSLCSLHFRTKSRHGCENTGGRDFFCKQFCPWEVLEQWPFLTKMAKKNAVFGPYLFNSSLESRCRPWIPGQGVLGGPVMFFFFIFFFKFWFTGSAGAVAFFDQNGQKMQFLGHNF
jgi:hypothetical protein